MLPRIVSVWKEIGETPLQALTRLRSTAPELSAVPLTYAGRLDPMAEGRLLVLVGDECKRQTAYRNLDKEYEIEVLLDIASDTGDVLGMPHAEQGYRQASLPALKRILRKEIGAKTVPYPRFSSKTVHGKPLFLHALEGTLDTITIPTHTETVYAMRLTGIASLSTEALRERIDWMLARAPRDDAETKRLGADFRQDAIRTAWSRLFVAAPEKTYTVLSLRVTCASGTYMRSLAERIGVALGTRALALSIRRTRVGRHARLLPFWLREYR